MRKIKDIFHLFIFSSYIKFLIIFLKFRVFRVFNVLLSEINIQLSHVIWLIGIAIDMS